MSKGDIICVVARMDWQSSLRLLSAMGRTMENTKVILDIERPDNLSDGIKASTLNMINKEDAIEIFVIGLASEANQEIIDRVYSLRECKEISANIPIHGLVASPETFKLDLVFNGYEERVV